MEFRYQAVDRSGEVISGQMAAASDNELIQRLRTQDLVPVMVEEILGRGAAGSPTTGTRRVRKADAQGLILLVRELATLLAAGVSLAEAVDSIAAAHSDTEIGPAMVRVYAELRGGAALSLSLRSAELAWPEYLFQLVHAGELTGQLASALSDAADQMEYEHRVRQEMRSALVYPSVLVATGIAATLLIFIVVVPRFSNMLKSSRAEIPAISRWVLEFGLFAKDNLLWISLGCAAVVGGLVVSLARPAVRRQLMEVASGLPLLGPWLLNSEIGRWATLLGTLLQAKVPVVQAMELAQQGVQLRSVSHKLQLALRELRAGSRLADALAEQQTVHAMGLNLVRVGERTGELPQMLKTLGGIYGQASRERMKRVLTLLEPLTILLIGSVIGFIMVAIMLAITSVSTMPL